MSNLLPTKQEKGRFGFGAAGRIWGSRSLGPYLSLCYPPPPPMTLNPKPQTPNPKPQTLNPKPQTLNPKPQTLNPKLMM